MLSAPALAAADPASTSPTTTTTTGTENPDLGYAALGFGSLAILLVLLFIRWDRHQTLEVQQHLAADGLTSQSRDVSAGDDGAGARAEVAGTAATSGSGKRVVVTAPGRQPLGLAFIGEGWGHVVVAIVLASITAALGLAGALSGEAVATLLGALVGYVVAKAQSSSPAGHSSALRPGVPDTIQSED